MRALLLALVVMLSLGTHAGAGTRKRGVKPRKAIATKTTSKSKSSKKSSKSSKSSSKRRSTRDDKAKNHARVAFSVAGELRPTREVVGRREEPLTIEEDVAKRIEKLLRGPLRRGITGLYVADARTGEPLFAVNADDPLNPASNVKMISTAAALDLLGPTFRYSTRVLGREPDSKGVLKGDVYLLGTWDPTLTRSDMSELGKQLLARGVKQLDGDVLVGSDPTRDGIYRAKVPIEIHAGDPGKQPTASAPEGWDFVEIEVKAKTEKRKRRRHRLKFSTQLVTNAAGHKRIKLTITGTIGKGGSKTYWLSTRERTALASHSLRAALRQQGITVNGDVRTMDLGDFIGGSVGMSGLPVELARHDSDQLQDIVRRVNKWSINWLADRVIMTAAALARRTTPSMQVGLEAMYAWLQRHPQVGKDSVVLDTGSGLSYRTRITPQEIVKVVRAAAGFLPGIDPTLSKAWHESLAVAGTDGTLRGRFRVKDLRGHLRGKTGTLSTVIALSGLIELDASRPLAFSIVTNTDRPLRKGFVRKAHEQLVKLLAEYVAQTTKPTSMPTDTPVKLGAPGSKPEPELDENEPTIPEDVAEPQLDPELDDEAAETHTLGKQAED